MILTNSYQLANKTERLSKDEIVKSLQDFNYLTSHYQQILTKERFFAPMRLNPFQQKIFRTLLPMIMPATRLEKRHNVILLKPRQVGASTGIVAFINYLCSFVEGMNHLNILHTFPVGDTISKFYKQKVEPILGGIHPDLFPTIDKDIVSKTSILTHYKDLRGTIQRDNYYELVSANADSVRSASLQLALLDECSFYRNPEKLEDAISPALPDYGFSLVVYLSTFDDQKSDYFLNKIKIAMEEPDDWTLIFTPWFEMYPEQFMGTPFDEHGLTDYDQNVILPALIDSKINSSKFGDYFDWYHRKSRTTTRMFNEYPTTLDEVLKHGEDECVFPTENLEKVEATIEDGKFYTLTEDVLTKQIIAKAVDDSPVKIFREPVKGHKYILTADPIASVDDKSDYFAASVFDQSNNEQVATILGRNRPLEDWAELSYALAVLYNRAYICPECNIAQAFVALIWAKGYYNWSYFSEKDRTNKNPGLRTTATTKPQMIDRLIMLLNNNNIIIHDINTLEQMRTFVVRKRKGNDARSSGRMEAKKGHHDDSVTCLYIYAGSLNQRQLVQNVKRSRFGWAIA